MLVQVFLKDHRQQGALCRHHRQEAATIGDHELIGDFQIVNRHPDLDICPHALGHPAGAVVAHVEILVGDDAQELAVKDARVGDGKRRGDARILLRGGARQLALLGRRAAHVEHVEPAGAAKERTQAECRRARGSDAALQLPQQITAALIAVRKLLARLNETGFALYCLAEIPPGNDPVRVMRYFRGLWLAYQNLL